MESRRRGRRALLCCAVLLGAGALVEAASGGRLPLDTIKLPSGFRIAVYAQVPRARQLARGPEGVVFVGSQGRSVYALLPSADRTRARSVVAIGRGLNAPNGVAFRNGALYVGEPTRILRYDDIMAHLQSPPRPAVLRHTFPSQGDHAAKYLAFGPDGLLYVPVGAPCNACVPSNPQQGTITRMRPEGTDFEVIARGVRNSEGLGWQPGTNALWFTDNGRDYLGENQPPDELNRLGRVGEDFGFPYCHGGDVSDPRFGPGHPCSQYTAPARKLGPHVASLGMCFYTGSMFPQEYRDRIFIAEHGSWNRRAPVGYRVTQVRVEGSRAVSYSVFAEGWLQGGRAWGRPVDVLVMPDGALLVSDDRAGVVYRISYGGE